MGCADAVVSVRQAPDQSSHLPKTAEREPNGPPAHAREARTSRPGEGHDPLLGDQLALRAKVGTVLELSAGAEARFSGTADVVGAEKDASLSMRRGNLEKIFDRALTSVDPNTRSDPDRTE